MLRRPRRPTRSWARFPGPFTSEKRTFSLGCTNNMSGLTWIMRYRPGRHGWRKTRRFSSLFRRGPPGQSQVRAQDYQGRLKELGWVSLTERRQRADMVLMNGIMTERMDIVKSDWFVPASIAERSTRQNTGSQNVKLTFGKLADLNRGKPSTL